MPHLKSHLSLFNTGKGPTPLIALKPILFVEEQPEISVDVAAD